MQVDVRAVNFQMSESLGDHAEKRLVSALNRFAPRIGWVNLRLTDDHGPRHGAMMHCSVEAAIPGHGSVVVEQHAPDLFEAIDLAAARMKRTVRRCINRRREMRLRPRMAG